MEFWPENQGQSPLYCKFGTVPGRNCTHNYHDRHQATHYPLYYGEQQDQGRESSYWTLPGSRTGGAPQEYTNWMDQELTAPTSSHFPFIIDRHTQQHQDLGEYQPYEARDREWTASQRAAREYERGFLREAWQRRWEPCSPVRYSRDVSTKRSDSSYRELEAWATRYSHSLPRRRRIEAELRGASQGLLESSRAPERDSRSGTDTRVAALQQVLQSANIRESGLWDRGGRQQAPTYYPSQTPATDTSHMLDMKEKTGYQRRKFSQPPGYIAPPPYNSPHKSSPILHHCDTSWEQKGKGQTYWSQPILRKQDVSVDLQDHRRGEKEDLTKAEGNQKTFPELEGLKHRRQETDAVETSCPTSIHIQRKGMLSLQQPQVLQAIQNKKKYEEPSSKVIEGRKFRLNKKTGGMTIFCLVSRIANTTETPSLSLHTSQTNMQNKQLGGASTSLKDNTDINQTHKLADEVDFRAPTLTEKSNTSDVKNLKAKQKETPTCIESEVHEGNLSDKVETDAVSPEKANTNDTDSTIGRQVAQSVQPVSVKYPLWREPSFTSRAETESPSTCLKANSEEDVLLNQEAKVHQIDVEVRRLDIKKDTESEDSKGLLVIDTTCVVVKMEMIQSPKKEHVHYFGSTPHTKRSPLDVQSTVSPQCIKSNSQLNQDVTTDKNAETNPMDIGLTEKKAPEEEGEISFPCKSSSSVSEKETMEERAERILGIPLQDCIAEQQPEDDARSLLDLCVEDQEVEPSPIKDNDINDAVEQIPEDTTEEEQSENQLEVGQTEDAVCLQMKNAKDQVMNEGGEDVAGPQEKVSNMSEENCMDSQLETEIKASPEIEMNEDPLLQSTSEEGTTEQSQEESQLVENYTFSKHPSQCLSPSSNLSNSSSLSPSPDCEAPNPVFSLMSSSSYIKSLLYISKANIEEGPDYELIALNSAENLAPYPETLSLPHALSQQLPSPLPPGSNDFSPSSNPHTTSLSPSPLDLIDQTAEAVSGTEDQDEKSETSQLIYNEISEALEDLAKDMTEELLSQQQFESTQPDDTACAKESNVTDEQQSKKGDKDHTDHCLEQTLQISQENTVEANIFQAEDSACLKESYITKIYQENLTDSQTQTEVSILQQEFDNGPEDVAFLKESYMTEEQSQKEADEDPTDDIMEQTLKIFKENAIEVNILQQLESCITEEQLPKEVSEDPTGLLEQTISKENATDSQNNILQDIQPHTKTSNSSSPTPSDSECKASQSPLNVLSPSELRSPPDALHKSDIKYVSPMEMESDYPSAPNPDSAPAAGIAETAVPPLHLDSCDKSESSPVLQQGSGSVFADLPLKEEPQYSKSLWDAVNRIRKHTAPDSENEEEEVSEVWDPESVGEDLGFPDLVVDMNSEKIVFDEAEQQEVLAKGSVKDVEVGQIQQCSCLEELRGNPEEDTLSCSSASSHGSGDTVIVADEDEVEETPPDAGTEIKTENDEEFQTAEGKQCCSDEVKDKTPDKEGEDDRNESVTNESSQSEECLVEVVNTIIKAEETTETEPKEEEEVFVPSEVPDEGMTESESVK